MRTEIVESVCDYFKSNHWNNYLKSLDQEEDNQVWHGHIYWVTNIHPDSMNKVLEGYFFRKNMELLREIDQLTPHPDTGLGALHNVHPIGLPHFDIFFRYSEHDVLAPMNPKEAENEKNALLWDKKFMDDFYSAFKFKAIGPYEEQQIRNYFKSRHWKNALNLILDPDVIHLHCNLKISFDPKILELIARDSLKEQGWTIDKVVPNVFRVHGEYTGKLVFIGTNPETIYDFGWKYDPNVVIEPDYENWNNEDSPPGFDWCLKSQYDEIINRDSYRVLTEDEINYIIEEIT